MINFPIKKRTFGLLLVLVPLLFLFTYVALRAGPLAPVSVTLLNVDSKPLSPSLYGIGTVEARYNYKIGSTFAGRISKLNVHVGDNVKAGQILGEIDPVDLDARIIAQNAALSSAKAQLQEAQARHDYASEQAKRYKNLLNAKSTSKEIAATKKQELLISQAVLTATQENINRLEAEKEALIAQRDNLRLISPVDGLVVKRNADPGTTVVAGQSVIEIIDPKTIWINVRFDQIRATGLAAKLPAHIKLKSRSKDLQKGHVLRVEPLADAVTEEILAKIVFEQIPSPLPPVGELVEVSIDLPELASKPVIINAAIKQQDGKLGVWKYSGNKLHFTPIVTGASSLDGEIQVIEGLKEGDKIVLYSEKALTSHTRIHVVKNLSGGSK